MDETAKKEEVTLNEHVKKAYTSKDGIVDEAEATYAMRMIERVNSALELREQRSIVFNGIPYSEAYEYNQKKGINYSPPKDKKDDREVSFGIPHEKVISFCSIFMKYVFKLSMKCYDDKGQIRRGLGEVYTLAVEFSRKLEEFKRLIGKIYWEAFTQGNAFVFEDWEVKNRTDMDAFNEKDEKIVADNMDYSWEFIDNLTFKEGKQFQTRRAISRVMDGRQVIWGNPEIEEVQDQPLMVIEEEIERVDAEQMFGSLKRWEQVPKDRTQITQLFGDKVTLFDASRLAKPERKMILHRVYDKPNNRFNLFLNGIMLLHRNTPFTLFYPRGNYPMSNVPAERLNGSIYARAVPAKTKFNADFIDWALKMLALKFEQGVDPAILAKGKYTLTRDMFRGGQVTHGVAKDDYEKADPDNKGVTMPEINFVNVMKEIVESQTVNPTTSGEMSKDATATEITTVESNQAMKLAYLLDGITLGFMDMALRRAETIESKYTMKQRETIVDGKKISVYQNFSISIAGIEHNVAFDEEVGSEGYDFVSKRDELHKKAFAEKKGGFPSEYYLVHPDMLKKNMNPIEAEIHPERVKDSQLQMIQMWDEFTQLVNTFGADVNKDEMKQIYLETSGRKGEIFTSADMSKLEEMLQSMEEPTQAYNTGSMGKPMKPRIKEAARTRTRI